MFILIFIRRPGTIVPLSLQNFDYSVVMLLIINIG